MPRPCKATFDLESGVRVTCDVNYLCANFSLPIGLSVLNLGPMYAKDRRQTERQIDVRHASSLNASALWSVGALKEM